MALDIAHRGMLFILLLAVLLLGDCSALQFRKNGAFKIVQFTDLHFGKAERDIRSQKVMRAVLAAEPDIDLIVLSGDMVSGDYWDRSEPHWFETRYKRVMEVMNEAGIPYAAILGNHDPQANLNSVQIIKLDMQGSPHSLTQMGPDNLPGAGNYWLTVNSAADPAKEAARIWMLDSPMQQCHIKVSGWMCGGHELYKWIKRESAASRHLPSMAFVHIPLPEHMYMWNSRHTGGKKYEFVSCRNHNNGLFQAFQHAGVKAVYSGHDHANNFIGYYDGIRLGYGQVTGHGGYAPPDGWQRGARVVVLREGQDPGESDTYVRQADGSVLRDDASWVRQQWWRLQLFCW